MKFRWQIAVLLGCALVCLFAFQAKLSQYDGLHTPVNDVSSNKIWNSLEKRTNLVPIPAEFSLLAFFATLSLFVLASIRKTPIRVVSRRELVHFACPVPTRFSGPTLFRRPPPAL